MIERSTIITPFANDPAAFEFRNSQSRGEIINSLTLRAIERRNRRNARTRVHFSSHTARCLSGLTGERSRIEIPGKTRDALMLMQCREAPIALRRCCFSCRSSASGSDSIRFRCNSCITVSKRRNNSAIGTHGSRTVI